MCILPELVGRYYIRLPSITAVTTNKEVSINENENHEVVANNESENQEILDNESTTDKVTTNEVGIQQMTIKLLV